MALDSTDYRKIIGCFATGVTVVTTNVKGRLHGFTANAVTSVSLDPLLLLVCVANGGTSHQELEQSDVFGVSILGADQEEISNTFAASGEPTVGSLRDVPFTMPASGAPLIDGALARLECDVDSRVVAGDHTIVMGRVLEGEILGDSGALLYYRGRYRHLTEQS